MKTSMIILTLILLIAQSVCSKETPSLYDYIKTWKNQNGEEITLSKFKGTYVLIGMVYTGCAHACPMTISKFQEIEKLLSGSNFRNFKFVLASFDIKKDTSKNLKAYMKKRKLDELKWTFLSTDKESTARELSLILGISYKDLGNGDFSHSNVITLLDPEGRIVHKIDNLNADISEFKAAIQTSK